MGPVKSNRDICKTAGYIDLDVAIGIAAWGLVQIDGLSHVLICAAVDNHGDAVRRQTISLGVCIVFVGGISHYAVHIGYSADSTLEYCIAGVGCADTLLGSEGAVGLLVDPCYGWHIVDYTRPTSGRGDNGIDVACGCCNAAYCGAGGQDCGCTVVADGDCSGSRHWMPRLSWTTPLLDCRASGAGELD